MERVLYTDRQIESIRAAARIVVECLKIAQKLCVPDGTTRRINDRIAEHIRERGGSSPFLGYRLGRKVPFPATVCTSVNDVVVHGLPDDRPLREGDLVSIDCGVRKGLIGDAAWTFPVGALDESARRLLAAGEAALREGIRAGRPRGPVSEISGAIQRKVEAEGFSVVREYVGHGVGFELHEEPQVPNFIQLSQRLPLIREILHPGTVIAIEPMVNEKGPEVVSDESAWPVRTRDGGRSVHFEHTVAVRSDRIEVLTAWDDVPCPI